MHNERPSNDPLYQAVRLFTLRAEGCDPVSITVRCANGINHTMEIPPSFFRHLPPPGTESDNADAPSWPPSTGWSHHHGRFSCDSQVFDLRGRSGEILRLLIDRGGSCDLETMRREIWDGYPCDDSVVRTAIRG
jgi:hypothetical protein